MNIAKHEGYPRFDIASVNCEVLRRSFSEAGVIIIKANQRDGKLLLCGLNLREQGNFHYGESQLEGFVVLIVRLLMSLPSLVKILFANKAIKEVIKFQHLEYRKVKFFKRVSKNSWEFVFFDTRRFSRMHLFVCKFN